MPIKTSGAFEILSVDLEKKRIGVALVAEGSARAEGPGREADEVREYTERATAEASESFGSLADKLRGALESRQKR